MEEVQLNMLLKYPLILPVNEEKTEYRGYLSVNEIDYEIFLNTPCEEFDSYELKMTPQLQKFKKEINNLINRSDESTVLKFLDDLKNLILSKTQKPEIRNLSHIYRQVINEFVELKEFYINIGKCVLAKDLSNVKIQYIDSNNRAHYLTVDVDFGEKENVFSTSEFSLPDSKVKKLFRPSSSLRILYKKFFNTVEKLQYFFDVLDNLDEVCWVLDPEKSTRKECYRRIALGNNISVIITFDPWFPSNPPDFKFLGPERIVEEFREKIVKNLENWDKDGDVVQEILKLLEMDDFPQKESKKAGDVVLYDSGECCICFSARLNDKLPEIVCSNQSCEQFFHRECLYQWLTSVSARKSLNEVHGNCPNCEKHISCPLN